MRIRFATGVVVAVVGLASVGCGLRESSSSATFSATKNLAVSPQTSLLRTSGNDVCSSLGSIYRSQPVVVPPPHEYEADQSFGDGDPCSVSDRRSTGPMVVTETGRYTFTWSASGKAGPVVVEISRDGMLWRALATRWDPMRPDRATADISAPGTYRIRVRSR